MIATLIIVIILATIALGVVSIKELSKVKNTNLNFFRSEANVRSSNDDYKFRIAC